MRVGRLDIRIINKNGTPADVTNDNRLKVQSAISSADSQGVARTPGIKRTTDASSIGFLVYDFSVSNLGAANGTLLGQTLKPGETVNFDGGAINNYYPAGTVTYDATGTEFLIIYNS